MDQYGRQKNREEYGNYDMDSGASSGSDSYEQYKQYLNQKKKRKARQK